jgi:hypothetical protein
MRSETIGLTKIARPPHSVLAITADEIVGIAQNYPFYKGAAVKDGKLYAVYVGAHDSQPVLFSVGQLEHIVWTLAALKNAGINQQVALQRYVLGLRRTAPMLAAVERSWVMPNLFLDLSDSKNATLVPDLPEGIPPHLKGRKLRPLLGVRFPELDDLLMNLAIVRLYRYDGNGGTDGQKTVRARLGSNEVLEMYPGAAHNIGINYWDDEEAIAARAAAAAKDAKQNRQLAAERPAPQPSAGRRRAPQAG